MRMRREGRLDYIDDHLQWQLWAKWSYYREVLAQSNPPYSIDHIDGRRQSVWYRIDMTIHRLPQ